MRRRLAPCTVTATWVRRRRWTATGLWSSMPHLNERAGVPFLYGLSVAMGAGDVNERRSPSPTCWSVSLNFRPQFSQD